MKKVRAKKDFIADIGQGTQKIHAGQVLDMPDTGEVLYWLAQGWVQLDKATKRKPGSVTETAAVDPGEKAVKPKARRRKKG